MKTKTKNILIVIGVFAALIIFVGVVTSGFKNWGVGRTVNEDNLYTAECMTLKDTDDGYGVKITVNEDGSFKVKGTATKDVDYEIGTVTLDKGTYTITAFEDASRSTVYVSANYDGLVTCADFSDNTFTIAADDTEVTLTLHVFTDAKLNDTIYPVIVSGEEPGEFYK